MVLGHCVTLINFPNLRCEKLDEFYFKCKARNNLGKLNGQQGKLKVAEKHLVSAFGLCPDNVLTHYFLGELYREGPLLNKRKALFHLNAVLRIDPEFSGAETIQNHIDNLTF